VDYVAKMVALDRALKSPVPAPIPVRQPSAAEIQAKLALMISRRGHFGTVAAAVGISPA
jgi:hypothetical protein